jgi:hypothetical protein
MVPPAGASGSRMDAYRLVEVVGWLRWKPVHPLTTGPGQAEQTKRHGSRSFVQWGAPPWPVALGPLPGGWADGDGMNSRDRTARERVWTYIRRPTGTRRPQTEVAPL